VRVARAKRLRGERRDRGNQAHAKREADKEDSVRQRRSGHRLGAETSDHGKVRRHHRDLAELRHRDRRRELQRLGKFDREMAAGHRRGCCCRAGGVFNLVERGHGGGLPRRGRKSSAGAISRRSAPARA
jgi:hypothetical protein